MWWFSIVCVVLITPLTEGARILGIFMTPSYSHQIVFQPIWRELSLRGHEVTVYTPSPLNDVTLTNLTEYDLSSAYKAMKNVEKLQYDVKRWLKLAEQMCDDQLSHPHMQDLINNANNDTYDLLLVESAWPTMYAFKEIYHIPMIGISSFAATTAMLDALGLYKHPVLDPDHFLPFSKAITLKQRIISWIHQMFFRFDSESSMGAPVEGQIKKFFKTVTKTFSQLTTEVNLIISNYNIVSQNIRPLVPKFVPVSAIHVRPQKTLPKDIAEILDDSVGHVVYFSLGSNVKSSELSTNSLEKILSVLGKLPYTILWKYETDNLPPDLPKNFIVRKWFPQQDLLGHPRVKLFITQGGLQSLDEAILRGVPMLVIPFMADQLANSDKIVNLGIGEMLDFNHFTENELSGKIRRLMTDPKYEKTVKKMQKIVADQPMSSLDTAIFWIEYVLRHDGAHHLAYGGEDLPKYQYYLLDVYAIFFFLVSILAYVFFKLTSLLIYFIRKPIKSKVL